MSTISKRKPEIELDQHGFRRTQYRTLEFCSCAVAATNASTRLGRAVGTLA